MFYLGGMKNQEQSSEQAQGAESEELTLSKVAEYLEKDLGVVIALLHAVQNDKALLQLMASHLHGRHLNHQAAVKRAKEAYPVE